MGWVFLLAAVVVVLAIGLAVAVWRRRERTDSTSAGQLASEALPYQKQAYLLTKAERAFYDVLCDAIAGEFLVFAKVRLADLVRVSEGTQKRQAYLNRITSKHVDFLLCDPKTVGPVAAIELDDASHSAERRRSRDTFVNEVLGAAGVPLVRVTARASYTTRELAEHIRAAVRTAEAERVEG